MKYKIIACLFKQAYFFAFLFNSLLGTPILPTQNAIIENNKQDEFMFILEDIFPEGCSETELNDFLWFDSDFIFSALRIKQS